MTVAVVRQRASAGRLPYAAVCVAVLAWGFGPIAVGSASVSGVAMGFWRLLVSIPAVLVLNRVTGNRLRWEDLRQTVTAGVAFSLSILTGFAAFKNTSIANATLIPSLMPAFVLLVAPRLFGEVVTRRQLTWATCAFGGIAMVVLGAGKTAGAGRAGDLLAVANLVLFSVYFLDVKRMRGRGIPPLTIVTGALVWGIPFVVPFGLLFTDDVWSLTGFDWMRVAFVAVVPGLIGHTLMAYAQRAVDVSVSSLITLANPVISTVGAFLILGQTMRLLQAVGAVVLLGSLAMIVVERRPSAPAGSIDDLEPI